MVIVLIGMPGSGKGTYREFIAKKFRIPDISVGDLLREMAGKQDELGILIQQEMAAGGFVSGDVVNKVIQQVLSSDFYKSGCVIDGYPRNKNQADFLSTLVDDLSVIYFDIKPEVVVERLLHRFSCAVCGQVYNEKYLKLKVEGQCDGCGSSKFTRRSDDDVEIIKKRIVEYNNYTLPLLDYYKGKVDCFVVNANKTPEQVELDVLKIIKMI